MRFPLIFNHIPSDWTQENKENKKKNYKENDKTAMLIDENMWV